MSDSIVDRRFSYEKSTLFESEAGDCPFKLFERWMSEAASSGLKEPNAMTVATADQHGHPSARVVLLRGWDELGFVFFSNYESRKGIQIQENPYAALLFFWDVLERQIRIEGRVVKLNAAESDAYFEKRPRGHKLSAWASPQSRVVSGRAALEVAMLEAEREYPETVPRPPYWGGYRVLADQFEFWQGRRNRVHDRLRFTYSDAGDRWLRERIAP